VLLVVGENQKPYIVFDAVLRFAQPLGIHLPDWEGRIVESKRGRGSAPVRKRKSQATFGEKGSETVAHELERAPEGPVHLTLFPEMADESPAVRPGRKGRRRRGVRKKCLLDAMLLLGSR